MKIEIQDIAYNDLDTTRLYQGNNLIWERNVVLDEYPEYDMVLDWSDRTYYTPSNQLANGAYSNLTNARNAASLCFRQGTKTRYSLKPYLEDAPSNLTKCNFNDLLGNTKLTSVANAFKGWQYLYGGFYQDTSNTFLRKVLWFRLPDTCTNASSVFQDCSELTMANLSPSDVSNVTTFSYIFSGCEKLRTVYLNGWQMKSNASVTNMFSNCGNLKNIYMIGCDEATIAKVESVKPKSASIITT